MRQLYPDLRDSNMTIYEAYRHANESARLLLEQLRTECISEMVSDPAIFTSWERLNSMLQVVDELVDIADRLHIDTSSLAHRQPTEMPFSQLLN